MTTYRERREAKAERLREWADKREAKSESAYESSSDAVAGIPMGQPILAGHHSQQRHQRAVDRSWSAMGRSVEHSRRASEMRSRADNIERAARGAIYSDDEDATERLADKLAKMEAKREAMKARNADFRKAHKADLKELTTYARDRAMPHQGYELTNLGGNISRTRKRLQSMGA